MEHHTHSWICVVFHLQFAAQQEWQVFICFLNRFVFELLNQNERALCSYAIRARETRFFIDILKRVI